MDRCLTREILMRGVPMMMKSLFGVSAAVLLAGAVLSAPAYAAAAGNAGVKVGVLNCNVDSGFGLILGSSRDVRCSYVPTAGAGERYSGAITKIGVDIGYIKGGI